LGKRRKLFGRDLRKRSELPPCPFLVDKAQRVGFSRYRYSVGHSVAAQLAVIDVGPFDFVPETFARAAILLQLANPSANRLERMPHGLCVGAMHQKLQWKQRFAGDARGKDFAALPHAQHLLAQIARRGPGRCISHRNQP
jgi:hypothetical protein